MISQKRSLNVWLKVLLFSYLQLSLIAQQLLIVESKNVEFDKTLTSNLNELQLDQNDELKQQQQPFWTKVTNLVQYRLASEIEYIKLIKRYHVWNKRYNAIYKAPMKNAIDVIKEEYAKVDEELQSKDCYTNNLLDNGEKNNNETESMDFVYNALKILIDRLEKLVEEMEIDDGKTAHADALAKLDSAANDDDDDDDDDDNANDNSEDNEKVQKAMERVKKTVVSSAKNFLTNEAKNIAQKAILNGAATYVAQQELSNPGSPIALLAPVIGLLGSASTPLLASYLRSVEIRTAMGIIKKFLPFDLSCKMPNLSKILKQNANNKQ